MDRHRLAFRRSLEQSAYSLGTVRQYVTAAGRLLKFCEGSSYDLYRGDVPGSLLEEFAGTLSGSNVRRLLRGAGLFVEFLAAQRDVPLPALVSPGADHLDRAQLDRFMSAAADEPEPYATLMRMLPMSGLRSSELSQLALDQVRRADDRIALAPSAGPTVELRAEAQELLRRYLDGWRAELEVESEALFPGARTGRPLGASTISRRLQRIQKRANLHDFRISALSDLYAIHFKPEPDEDDQEAQEGDPSAPSTPLAGLPDDEGPAPTPEPPPEVTPDADGEGDLPADNDDSDARAGPPSEDRVDQEEDRYRTTTPSTAPQSKARRQRNYPGKEIAKILPRSGSVVIRKRFDGGRLGYIGQYQVTDFGEDGAIEPFIHRHLLPHYGGGDYLIYKNALTDKPLHVVHILAPQRTPDTPPQAHPSSPSSPGSVAGLLREHLEAAKVLKDATESSNPYELVNAVTRIATLQGQGASSNDELRRLREDLDQLRRELLLNPPPGSLGLPGGIPLPPAAPPAESTLTQQLLKQFLDSAQRDRERLDELMRSQMKPHETVPKSNAIEHIRETKQVADAVQDLVGASGSPDKIDRLLEIIAGPIGMKVGEWAMNPKLKKKTKKSPLNGARSHGEAPADELEREPLPSEVPSHFAPYAQKMDAAETEEELVENMMFGLASLNLDPRWKPAVRAAFQAMLNNRKTETFILTWDILEALVRGGHLEEDTARIAITACRDSWDEVRARVMALLRQRAAG